MPYLTETGSCTPLYCAAEVTPVEVQEAPEPMALVPAPAVDVAVQAEAVERRTLGAASGRLQARKAFLKVPEGMGGAEAEAWADSKLVSLLPLAVAEKEYQLLYGDDEQRSKAADRILEATGRGKRDGSGGANQPLIVLVGQGVMAPPWSSKARVVNVTPTLTPGDEPSDA